jgi:uncharacterized protein (DUF1015 family)
MVVALRLYAYGEGMVFPHETTFAAPKADRLQMLRTIQKDLEPVFLIYSDPENASGQLLAQVTQRPPVLEVEDELQAKHQVWRVTEPEKIAALQKALEKKALVITDGHHRYESALAYRAERQKQVSWTEDSAFNFHMSYIVPVQDEGLIILPTHRLLRKFELTPQILEALNQYFAITELPPKEQAIEDFLKDHKTAHAFGVYNGQQAYGLVLKDEKLVAQLAASKEVALLDVVILRDVVFKTMMQVGELKIDEDIMYERSTRVALEKVDTGEAKLAFLMNPISPEVVWQVAQKRERLPEKSTDFYPKPASGLMMMDISAEDNL